MNKLKLVFFTILLVSFATIAQTTKEIAKIGIASTVSIVALDNISQPLGYGSGFIIDDELIATNVHVIEGSSSAYVLINGQEKKYKVSGYVSIDKSSDLVIVKVTGLYGNKLNLSTESIPEIGEKIYAIGNPKGLNGTFSEGIISGIRDIANNKVLQITAPISPGSSGGPVLNSTGQVVGVAFASFASGQNLNFAIPIKYLLKLKSNIGSIIPLSTLYAQIKTTTSKNIATNIKEGVTIRSLAISPNSYPEGGVFVDFSIKNNLEYTVKNITLLLLGIDATGTVIDYYEFTYEKEIKPFLAKSFSGLNDEIQLTGKVAKLKARVLNFEIIEN